MANLIRLTTTKVNRLTNIGSYSFNALKIKKVSALGTGSLLYYHDGTPGIAGIVKIEVAENPTTVKAALSGSLDMQIELNVVAINGKDHVLVENIKTSDIVLGKIDSDSNYSILTIGDNQAKYKVNNTLTAIETTANNYTIGGSQALSPLTNQTFNGQFNLSTNYEVYYNTYSTNTTVTPTVVATPLVGAVARVVFDAGASASLIATNLGTLRVGSDNFTVGKKNEIVVYMEEEGLYYMITVLN